MTCMKDGDVLKQTDRSFHAGTESRWETEIKKKKCWNKTLLADLNNGNRTVSVGAGWRPGESFLPVKGDYDIKHHTKET